MKKGRDSKDFRAEWFSRDLYMIRMYWSNKYENSNESHDLLSDWPLNTNRRYTIQLNLGLRYHASPGAWYLFRMPMAANTSASLVL
jgi:hypothetical protein